MPAHFPGIGGEHPGLYSIHFDWSDLFAQRGDPLPRGGNAAAAAPPARQVVVRGRTVCRKEPASDGGRRGLRIDGGSRRAPCAASQVSGRVNRTRCPTLGAKHRWPANAAGFRIVPQLCPSLAPNAADPVSRPTSCTNSSRVITRPSSAVATASVRRSSSSSVIPKYFCHDGFPQISPARARERHATGAIRRREAGAACPAWPTS